MKGQLGGKIMTEFAALRPTTYYSYLTDDNDESKKAKDTKKCAMKQKLKFEDYKNCLEANQLKKEINYHEKNKLAVDSWIENHKKLKKQQINIKIRKKDLEVRNAMYLLIILTRLYWVLIIIKELHSIDSTEIYAYGTIEVLKWIPLIILQ